jgi:hypothetical protein
VGGVINTLPRTANEQHSEHGEELLHGFSPSVLLCPIEREIMNDEDDKKVKSLLPYMRADSPALRDPVVALANELCKIVAGEATSMAPKELLCSIVLTLKATGAMVESSYGQEVGERLRMEALELSKRYVLDAKDYNGPTVFDPPEEPSNVIPFKRKDPQ